MHIYISWYYWYKNFWDELLLLWMLNYITKVSINNISKITIECKDPNFLTNLLQEYISSNLYKTWENSWQKLEILPVNKVKTDVDSLSIRYKKWQWNNLWNTFRTVYIQCRQRVRNAWRSWRVKNTYDYVYIGGGEALTSARNLVDLIDLYKSIYSILCTYRDHQKSFVGRTLLILLLKMLFDLTLIIKLFSTKIFLYLCC